ncbi:T9SS type A sorting domain-containing protein [Pontibacter ruber]|uniref:T9SS type A sorting domain-containing protein n=1 Tax=Pontibacter ruber TaxID=1343895 RepID=A0ABW5CZR9_9BACT
MFALVFVLFSFSAKASTYYVSATGNDSNSGTSTATAWASIAKVNAMQFLPGDTILFEGGVMFPGSLYFGSNVKGTASKPIVISSYGTDRAVISSGTSKGIMVYNSAGFKLKNLVFQGAGRTTNTTPGVEFYMDLPYSRLEYIAIENVEVYGYQQAGISIGSWKQSSGFDNVSITRCAVHDNGKAGIESYAEARLGHSNVYVGYNKVYNNAGIPTKTDLHSGNGIVLGGVNGGTIEYCEAYNNGWLNAWRDGGPVGIWGWHCNNLIIQYNESHHNKTGTTKDGGGFDIDGGSTNCIMQYNYSHDNEGAGYLIAQYNYAPEMKGIIVRYNISENDGRRNGYGGIHLWSSGANGGIQDAHIYNNTIYMTPAASGIPKGVWIQQGGTTIATFRNNIIQVSGGLQAVLGEVTSNIRFEGNNYWASDSNLKITWAGTTHSTLDNWRTSSGQEKLNGVAVGYTLNPELQNPGNGITITNPAKLYSLTGYQLKETSALVGKGLDLAATFGMKIGERDFYGNKLTQRKELCIGAHQVTDNSRACLEGGLIPLSFGQAAGGTYSGTGISDGNWFNPAIAGEGNHALTYSYLDANKQQQLTHHTVTVVPATATQWTGKAGTDNWFNSKNWSTCTPTAKIDATVPVSADLPTPSIKEGQKAVTKNLNAAGTLVVADGASLEVYGSLSGSSLQTQQNSTLIFSSSSSQNAIAGSFGKLVLENSSSIKLAGPVTIAGELDLGKSKLYLGNNNLIIKDQGTIKNASNLNYVITDGAGKLTQLGLGAGRKGIFPVGTAKGYAPVILENKGITDNFSVSVVEGYLQNGTIGPLVTEGVINKTWHIEEETTGGSDVNLTLQWNEADELSKFNRDGAYITHYEDSEWNKLIESIGSVPADTTARSFTSSISGITSFSPFSVGSSQYAPLPVSLILFKASIQGDNVLLNWETASERNSRGFGVEMSLDGTAFRPLGFVASKTPDSNQKQRYSYLDFEPDKTGTRYYRLRQVDLDGSASYSPVQAIVMNKKSSPAFTVYPNPFSDVVTVELEASEAELVELTLTDTYGKTILKQTNKLQIGRNAIRLEVSPQHPAGFYLLTAKQGDKTYQIKLIRK